MKTISVAELKAHLSRHLRSVAQGERIVVTSRGKPVAQLVPHGGEGEDSLQRMAREGRLRLGTQDWSRLKFTPVRDKKADVLAILENVRGERD